MSIHTSAFSGDYTIDHVLSTQRSAPYLEAIIGKETSKLNLEKDKLRLNNMRIKRKQTTVTKLEAFISDPKSSIYEVPDKTRKIAATHRDIEDLRRELREAPAKRDIHEANLIRLNEALEAEKERVEVLEEKVSPAKSTDRFHPANAIQRAAKAAATKPTSTIGGEQVMEAGVYNPAAHKSTPTYPSAGMIRKTAKKPTIHKRTIYVDKKTGKEIDAKKIEQKTATKRKATEEADQQARPQQRRKLDQPKKVAKSIENDEVAPPQATKLRGGAETKKRKVVDDDDEDEQPVRPAKAPRVRRNVVQERVEFSPTPPPEERTVAPAATAPETTATGKEEAESDKNTLSSTSPVDSGYTTPEAGPTQSPQPKTAKTTVNTDRGEKSGKGVAKKTKKAPHASNTAGRSTSRVKKATAIGRARRGLNGMKNHMQACFSIAVVQMLDAALDDVELDAVMSAHDINLESFGMSEKDLASFDMTAHGGTLDSKLAKKQRDLRAAIKSAAKSGETEKVSVAKHLRGLLHYLREERVGAADKNVSPYIFQSVAAFGAAEDADRPDDKPSYRQETSGDAQQDCFEHYQSVLDSLKLDEHTANKEQLQKLFGVISETQDVCQTDGCDYKSDLRTVSDNYHNVDIPETSGAKSVNFHNLLKASQMSAKDGECPKCKNRSLVVESKFTTLPDNLVIKTNRASFNELSGETAKIETNVDLQADKPITIKGEVFEMTAVIRHSGASIEFGHYTILRKMAGEWFLLDDKNCTKKTVADVRDHPRQGKCAMILLKKKAEGAASSAK
jgi:hypothetical protein